ncbi:MAG TPA: TetR/AcrR family transcriptional regulator [Anaeromyxobacteraceae bacterium]|nr:TetR/AcrR family transcriptional regulator [Anaeromyxobacteraceae bacterium]
MGGKLPGRDDRRVRRTRGALREALVALIVERGWDGFSVQDLCAKADVGRSTFYMHFADKEEVLGGAFADLGRELRAQVTRSGAARPLGFSRGLLEHAQEHLRVFRAWVGRRSGHVVQGKMRDLVLELVREDLAGLLPPGARRDGTAAFLTGAFFELLIWSLEAKPPATAAAADALFQELAGPVLAAARLPGAPERSRGDAR